MTISLVASNATPIIAGATTLTLSSTEGNLQVCFVTHRSGTQTPTITGADWSTAVLIESSIGNTNQRRAIAMFWRVVPAGQSASITLNWSGLADRTAFGYEWSTNTVGGTWSFDGTNDNAHTGGGGGTSLASNAVTPTNNEAVSVVGLVARNGDVAAEDSYSDSFTTGPSASSGAGANQQSGFSGYRIVDTTPAAMSTIASWSTTALATALIGAWSVSGGTTTPEVTASIPLTLAVGGTTQATHQATAAIPLAVNLDADTQATHAATAAIPLTVDVAPVTDAPGTGTAEVTASIPLAVAVGATAQATHEVTAGIPLAVALDATATAPHQVEATVPLSLTVAPVTSAPGVGIAEVTTAIPLTLALTAAAATEHSATAPIPLTVTLVGTVTDPTEPPPSFIGIAVGPLRDPLEVAAMREPLTVATIDPADPATIGALRDTTPTVGVLRDDDSPTVDVLRDPLEIDPMRDPVTIDELRE